MTAESETNWVGARWKILLEVGAWIATLIGGFLLLPSYLDPSEVTSSTKLGQFLAAAVAGLLLIPLTAWSKPRYLKWWWILCVALLAASLSSFFHYNTLINRDTVPYDTIRVVAGSESQYTSTAKHYADSLRQQRLPATRDVLIMDAGGRTQDLWPEEVLRANAASLRRTYFLTLGLFASFIVLLAHVLSSGVGTKKKRRRTR